MPVPDGTSSTSSWREVCPSPTPARLTRPLLAAVQEPSGAPESLATGPLAHQPAHQGWLGGPGHRNGSVGVRGFASTPNPDPPPYSPVGVGCVGFFESLLLCINLTVPDRYVHFW
jgi:hypothetical protein